MRKVNIRVRNIEESKFVQEFLFATGAKWASGDTQPLLRPSYLDTTIAVEADGQMWCGPEDGFPYIDIEKTTVYKLIDNRPKIVFQGKTYFVHEVEAAIKVFGVTAL